jgi:aryl-alcohol dehydrogenase
VPDDFIPRLVELHRQGRLPLEKLTRYYALDDIKQAVQDCESGRVIKAVLRP